MIRKIIIMITIGSAIVFAWMAPLTHLFDAIQTLVIVFSIMAATMMMRLDHGIPSVEWGKLTGDERTQLSTALVRLATEYGWIIGIQALVIALLIALLVIGRDQVALWSEWTARGVSGCIGGLIGLCVARMTYVIWRSIDIMRLQKILIDDRDIDALGAKQMNNRDSKI